MGLAHLAYLGIGHDSNASAREQRISSQLGSYAAFCLKSLRLIPLDVWKGMRSMTGGFKFKSTIETLEHSL